MPLSVATLRVDLNAIARNYALLKSRFSGAECAAVVKANGYGLGAIPVANRLLKEGCRIFFVATLEEGLELRPTLPHDVKIYVFQGPFSGEEKDYLAHGITPVLNSMEHVESWRAHGNNTPAALHIDTGMCRLGLSVAEVEKHHLQLTTCDLRLLMTHLACASDPAHPMNLQQAENIRRAAQFLPNIPISFANSAGVFLPRADHFDIARPGCALYGINPFDDAPNPMENVVELTALIIQLRAIDSLGHVGYGATRAVTPGMRVATIAFGYADGLLRHMSNKGTVFIGETAAPIIGRVSMDMIMVDVTHLPPAEVMPGKRVTLIGKHQTVDVVAREAGTIGYEIFTRLGNRVHREYVGE